MTTSFILVWYLVTGYDGGGHVPPAQFGPFATVEDCKRVEALPLLKRYDKQCVQVKQSIWR